MKRYWVFDYQAGETPLRDVPALLPALVDEQGAPRQGTFARRAGP